MTLVKEATVAVTHMHFQPGATWTFVHSHGDRTEYVYDHQIVPGGSAGELTKTPLDAMHALLNRKTDKFAQVTEGWLRRPPLSSAISPTGLQSHWLAAEAATAETTRDYLEEREAARV